MIAVCFTTPAILYKLKWNWNLLYVVGILENQCSTLKEDGSIQTLVPSRKGVASQYLLFIKYILRSMFSLCLLLEQMSIEE